MLPYALLDCLFQLRGLEQRRSIRYPSDGFIGLKNPSSHSYVYLFAGLQVQSQSTQHYGDQTTSPGSTDKIEVVCGFRYLIPSGRFAFNLHIGPMHKFLNDNKHGIATDATSIWYDALAMTDEKLSKTSPKDSIRSGGPFVVSFRRKAPLLSMMGGSSRTWSLSGRGGDGNRRDRRLAAGAARKFRRAVLGEDDCVHE